jgi:hypothetical protein
VLLAQAWLGVSNADPTAGASFPQTQNYARVHRALVLPWLDCPTTQRGTFEASNHPACFPLATDPDLLHLSDFASFSTMGGGSPLGKTLAQIRNEMDMGVVGPGSTVAFPHTVLRENVLPAFGNRLFGHETKIASPIEDKT